MNILRWILRLHPNETGKYTETLIAQRLIEEHAEKRGVFFVSR